MEEKSGAVCRRLLKMAMSKQMQRCKEQPPPKRRKGSLKLDPNLVPGTRHGPQAVTCHGWPFVDFESLILVLETKWEVSYRLDPTW